jgi:hypothetical protein
MAYTIKQAQLKTKYPITDGIVAETTTQQGHKMQLEAEEGTFVPKRETAGIDY